MLMASPLYSCTLFVISIKIDQHTNVLKLHHQNIVMLCHSSDICLQMKLKL